MNRILICGAAVLLLAPALGGCFRERRSDDALAGDLAGRRRPIPAPDVAGDGAIEPAAGSSTWAHTHIQEVDFSGSRGAHEPSAPHGTTRLTLQEYRQCRCGESALEILGDGIHLADLGAVAPQPTDDGRRPRVESQLSGGVLWVWVTDARDDTAYTVHVSADPPDALAADPLGTLKGPEFLRYPIVRPLRTARARFIREESILYPKVD